MHCVGAARLMRAVTGPLRCRLVRQMTLPTICKHRVTRSAALRREGVAGSPDPEGEGAPDGHARTLGRPVIRSASTATGEVWDRWPASWRSAEFVGRHRDRGEPAQRLGLPNRVIGGPPTAVRSDPWTRFENKIRQRAPGDWWWSHHARRSCRPRPVRSPGRTGSRPTSPAAPPAHRTSRARSARRGSAVTRCSAHRSGSRSCPGRRRRHGRCGSCREGTARPPMAMRPSAVRWRRRSRAPDHHGFTALPSDAVPDFLRQRLGRDHGVVHRHYRRCSPRMRAVNPGGTQDDRCAQHAARRSTRPWATPVTGSARRA